MNRTQKQIQERIELIEGSIAGRSGLIRKYSGLDATEEQIRFSMRHAALRGAEQNELRWLEQLIKLNGEELRKIRKLVRRIEDMELDCDGEIYDALCDFLYGEAM